MPVEAGSGSEMVEEEGEEKQAVCVVLWRAQVSFECREWRGGMSVQQPTCVRNGVRTSRSSRVTTTLMACIAEVSVCAPCGPHGDNGAAWQRCGGLRQYLSCCFCQSAVCGWNSSMPYNRTLTIYITLLTKRRGVFFFGTFFIGTFGMMTLAGVGGGAGVVHGAVAAKDLSVEQKEWIADQIIAKKQSAKEIAEQYHLTVNFVCSLARRRRKGQTLHATGGRPPGAKNKGPTVKKKLRAPGVALEVMPGMGGIAPAAPNTGANEVPNPPEPVAVRGASARVAGLPFELL